MKIQQPGLVQGSSHILRVEINPNLTVIHYMNHIIELAVYYTVKHITDATHFQTFTDSLHAFFSQSRKHI